MGIKERISAATPPRTRPANTPRVNNIHLLADALDGKLVAPGSTFSFNGAVGQRTAEKGYQEANAIVNGKLVPQLGGGICQVGTTIFNAVFVSGLPVVERQQPLLLHLPLPEGPRRHGVVGRPDFKFKNDYRELGARRRSRYTDSSITIALYGTDPGYEVESETGLAKREAVPDRGDQGPQRCRSGVAWSRTRAWTGKTITVTRTVTKDGKVVRTDTFVSVYKPRPKSSEWVRSPRRSRRRPRQYDPKP